ncbi:MAG: hypothetical protein Kow0075_13660 [Salibacteraceae bacterium]
MRFAVTGGNGLVGRSLTRALIEEGHEVVVLFRSSVPKPFSDESRITLRKCDLTDVEGLRAAFDQVDGVFHVAAYTKPWARNPRMYYEVNEMGTQNVCNAALMAGVKRVVYTASAGIHGPQQSDKLIDENTWPEAYFTDYERSKYRGMQKALSFVDKGLEVCVVSPARVYAVEPPSGSNVPVRMVCLYLKRNFGVVPADGTGIGSYVFMDDVVNGHILAMTKGTSGEEYLLGGDNLTYIEFFDRVKALTKTDHRVIKIPYAFSLFIGKTQLWMAENFGIEPIITTPWVRKYIHNWGIDSSKIAALGYRVTSFERGMHKVLGNLNC